MTIATIETTPYEPIVIPGPDTKPEPTIIPEQPQRNPFEPELPDPTVLPTPKA